MSISEHNVQAIVEQLSLNPHPEGGYYKEEYRSSETVNLGDEKSRSAGTAIYFLLPPAVCTNWHRVASDELWHFYDGDQLILELIDTDGNFTQLFLNNELSGEGKFQQLIPKNCWQRAYSTGDFTLVGCTVAPGFEFEDFEMIGQEKLAECYSYIAAQIMANPFSE